MKICSIKDCNRKHKAKGLCSRHYDVERKVKNPNRLKQWRTENRDYVRERRKQWGAENSGHIKAYGQKWYAANKERFAAEHKKRTYGITMVEYTELLMQQNNLCKICLTEFSTLASKRIHIDHDHTTGIIRGILCSACNVLLGNARDNIMTLRAAISYLNTNGNMV